jgi:hypothetical protein
MILTSFILGSIILMSGCASKDATPKEDKNFTKQSKNIKKPQKKKRLSSYTNIIVMPVEIISYIPKASQTIEQRKLYQEISDYINAEYELIVDDNPKYTLSEKKSKNTLLFESAISTVEVGSNKNQYTPVPMGLNVVSFDTYMQEKVRLLGEKRLVDAQNNQIITKSINIQDSIKISIEGDTLTFKDIQPALDSWLDKVKKDLK